MENVTSLSPKEKAKVKKMDVEEITSGLTKIEPPIYMDQNKMEITHHIDVRGLYNFISNRVGKMVLHNSLKTLTVYEQEEEACIGLTAIGHNDLAALVPDKNMKAALLVYINDNFRFKASPKIRRELFIWKPDGSMNIGYTPDNYKTEMYKQKINVDYKTGMITIRKAFPPVIDEQADEFERLVRIIVGDDMLLTIKNFMAQLAFEKRINKSGRSSLILWGDRGTGKGFLVEQILRRVVEGMATPLPINFQSFNGFMDNKLIYLDENESKDLDMMSVSKLAKKISGGLSEIINKKNMEPYKILMSCHFAVMSNSKPINITEKPNSDKDNQWIAIKMEKPLNENVEFNKFRKKHGSDLTAFIRNNIGAYMRDVLLPLYLESREKYKDYRYGFPIPITEELNELIGLSESNYESDTLNMMEYIHEINETTFADSVIGHPDEKLLVRYFNIYKQHYLLENKILLSFLRKKFGVTNKQFKSILSKHKFGSPDLAQKRIDNRRIRGYLIKVDQVEQFFNEPEPMDVDDDFNYELI